MTTHRDKIGQMPLSAREITPPRYDFPIFQASSCAEKPTPNPYARKSYIANRKSPKTSINSQKSKLIQPNPSEILRPPFQKRYKKSLDKMPFTYNDNADFSWQFCEVVGCIRGH